MKTYKFLVVVEGRMWNGEDYKRQVYCARREPFMTEAAITNVREDILKSSPETTSAAVVFFQFMHAILEDGTFVAN